MRTHYCGLINSQLIGQEVTLCGWAHRRRDHGGVIFIDLRDREGIAQIVCDPDRPEMFSIAESVRNEFCLRVTGRVRARGVPKINLLVRKENAGVLAFYEALGWRDTHTVCLYRALDPDKAEIEARQKAEWAAMVAAREAAPPDQA